MEADVLAALKTKAAYLSGSRDLPIIIVKTPTAELKSTWKKQPLELCLQYLLNSLSKETLNSGLSVIIDIQFCSWRNARNAIQLVYEQLNNKNTKLYAVRSDVLLNNCTKLQQYSDVTICTKLRLQKLFNAAELPEELGGTIAHDFDHWLKNRIRIDDFQKSYNKVMVDLSVIIESLNDLKAHQISEISEALSERTTTNVETQNIIKLILKSGNKLSIELNESLNKSYCHSKDIIDAIEHIRHMLNQLEQKQTILSSLWNSFEVYSDNLKTLRTLGDGIKIVTSWILNTGEELAGKQQQIGNDLKTTETLRDKHDELEIKCVDTYAFYAAINYKIARFIESKDPLTAKSVPYKNLLSQKRFMNFLCRSFASRLEKRRTILIKCIQFYRLVTTYFERTGHVFDEHIIGNNVDSFDGCVVKLKMLRETCTNLERIVDELAMEGDKLSDILSVPVKDVLGRDIGIDYSTEIVNVREIITETHNRRNIFRESVELQILTFEQIIYIHAYEQDALAACKWIDELLNVTIKAHSCVGGNIFEIQRQKQSLQKIHETAKRIFEYGNQLLEASCALRTSCKLGDSDNRQKIKGLVDTWTNLDTISQEQMIRLRVSAVFHRTLEEQCQQLKDLKEAFEAESSEEDTEEKLLRVRLHLLNREQLLVEIGRMVRLGKLLRSRLKEPFGIDPTATNREPQDENVSTPTAQAITHSNAIAASAINDKLSEVSKIAESLDNLLRDTQAFLKMNNKDDESAERKNDGETSMDSRGSIEEINLYTRSSTEDESFVTASECTLTPHSHSSSFETASEGGLMSPWWASSGTDKNSFETCSEFCSSSDMDSEVPSIQLLSGVVSSVTNTLYDATMPSNSDDEHDGPFTCDHSSWSLVTKHTVKGCL